jgi:hypothetical protein
MLAGLLMPLVLLACGDPPTDPAVDDAESAERIITPVEVLTYDNSGQSVHPDVAVSPSWWHGEKTYLAVTPYPGGDVKFENPSLYSSVDGARWAIPAGGSNPLVEPEGGYLSDPDIVFDPSESQLRVYFRKVLSDNIIMMMHSGDGVNWSEPEEVVRAPSHQIVSPAIVRMPKGGWMMWSINAGESGCGAPTTTVDLRRSADGITWGEPVQVDMPLPPSRLTPWHIEVQWMPDFAEYWALFNAKEVGGCGTTALYLATSKDGEHWKTRPNPVVVAGSHPALEAIVYRSTFVYDATRDRVTLWYSGARGTSGHLVWSTVVERIWRKSLFRRAGASLSSTSASSIPKGVVLLDPP